MYMNSINSKNTDYTLSSFGNVFISNDATADPKTVNFPNGYNLDSNLAFKVVFTNGHAVDNDTSNMTLNDTPVVVNRYGTLIPIPNHKLSDSSTIYSTLQSNCVLEMYYTDNYDGNGNPAFVVVGNPVVLSSTDYTIYADGKIGDETIGDIKASSLAEIPYGWLECNGQTVSRSMYSELFTKFSTQLYDDPSGTQDPTHTLLSRYGEGDGSTTFNLPDYRECALVGVGSNGTFIIDNENQSHEVHTLGEFKDDQFQQWTATFDNVNHPPSCTGIASYKQNHTEEPERTVLGGGKITLDPSTVARTGMTTHGKQIGITYMIKVL